MSDIPRNRKWRLALWGMSLGTAIVVAAIAGWVFKLEGSIGVLGQGLGLITLIFGGYSAVNVAQKNVEKKDGK